MHLLPLLALSGSSVGLIFGLAGMAFVAVFGVLGMYFHHRRAEQWHHTARLALEKGQPLPEIPAAREELKGPADARVDDIRSGLILIGTGLGLYLFLGHFLVPALGYVGAIPGFIGIAMLLVGVFRPKAKDPADTSRPPQA